MAASTYSTSVIVLRKTKLSESDLILTLLAADGSQLRAVAKGARKPGGSFASRLELFSNAKILCSKGKSLDIIKEARLLESNEKLRQDFEYAAGAAPMVELLDKITQTGLEAAKFYDMTLVALKTLDQVEVAEIPSITAAHLLKTLAFSGLRPNLSSCVICGRERTVDCSRKKVHISFQEGGFVCHECGKQEESILIDTELVLWLQYLLGSSFADIAARQMNTNDAFQVLHFCQGWITEHIGYRLKSLQFMFTNAHY